MKRRRLRIILSLLVALVTGLHAKPGYYFKRLSTRDGVPSKIFSVYVDKNDLVWAGGRESLVRLDGQGVKNYVHDNAVPGSIPQGAVQKIGEDYNGRMWVLTASGVCFYRPLTDDFEVLRTAKGKFLQPYDMCKVPDGVVFICRDGIYKYSN